MGSGSLAERRPARGTGRRARWRRGLKPATRRALTTEGWLLASLLLANAVIVTGITASIEYVPASSLSLVLLVGGFVLPLRSLLVLLVVVVLSLLAIAATVDDFRPGSVGVVVLTGLLVLFFAKSRSRLGTVGMRGETMLFDLRDRLRAQGEIPPLPPGWHAEVVLRSAYGASFSGDFLVATRTAGGTRLEVVLVDVSGKGMDAGTRALLLSGAFGGLLGAMDPDGFLPAANAYLLRQAWDEGFATAAHIVVDLPSGGYSMMVAGHPPAARFSAGSGRWMLVEAPEGPMLGIVPDAHFARHDGRLEPGDALLLYTDGLVETPGRDLSVGIDRLLGEAERLVPSGFHSGAKMLVDRVDAGEGDDRALLLLWRS